jgi:hypothetical protein
MCVMALASVICAFLIRTLFMPHCLTSALSDRVLAAFADQYTIAIGRIQNLGEKVTRHRK